MGMEHMLMAVLLLVQEHKSCILDMRSFSFLAWYHMDKEDMYWASQQVVLIQDTCYILDNRSFSCSKKIHTDMEHMCQVVDLVHLGWLDRVGKLDNLLFFLTISLIRKDMERTFVVLEVQ
jgi:hypothetical protein